MAKKLSLFIEDNYLRVLLCENERVVKWANLPLEAGLIANGVVTDEEKLAELIKQQFNFLRIDQKVTVLGLTGLNSLYRIITMPQMPDKLLGEAIQREAERAMPIVMNDVYISYQVIPEGKANEKRVFVAAFQKAAADSMLRSIRKAGLEPYMLDLAPLALSRTVNQARAVAVNSRGLNLDIVVVVDKVPQVLRSLSLPGEVESMTERLAAIAEEVERTIAFYNQSQQEKPLAEKDPILVTGDLAQMKESWDILASRLGHPVNPINSPLQEPAGFDAAQFMVNIGLVLKESPREKGPEANLLVNFNALPAAYSRIKISVLNIAVSVVAVVVLGAVVLMGFTTMGVRSHVAILEVEAVGIQNQITTTQTAVATLKTQIKQLQDQVKPLEDKTTGLSAKVATFKINRTNKDEHTSLVVRLLPKDVNLTSINYAANDISMEGKEEKLDAIYGYARDIRATNLFSVVLSSIAYNEETEDAVADYTYQFSLKVR
jgi:type IV pilus assembly protein PilM